MGPSRAPFWDFFGPQDASKTASRAPKTRLRAPKRSPRPPQERPRGLQDHPGSAQAVSKSLQDRPKSAQDMPKSAQDASKTAPRAPKTPGRRPRNEIQTYLPTTKGVRRSSLSALQSGAHLPVCFGVLDPSYLTTCSGSRELRMLPPPRSGQRVPPHSLLANAVSKQSPSRFQASSMHVQATFSIKMAPRALQM